MFKIIILSTPLAVIKIKIGSLSHTHMHGAIEPERCIRIAAMEEQGAVGVGRRLPFYRKLAFSSGHFLMVLAVAMWFSYSVVFFEKVLKIPASSTGTIILISQIFGAISTPFVGMWSDDCKCRYGRRKIFHLMGNVSVACFFFFIWYEYPGFQFAEDPYKVLYYASFAAMFQFGAAVQIAQLSLIPELTSDKNMKVELNSIRLVAI